MIITGVVKPLAAADEDSGTCGGECGGGMGEGGGGGLGEGGGGGEGEGGGGRCSIWQTYLLF